MDTAIADDPKETAKLSQYKELYIAVSRVWKVRTKTVPVTIGALETIKKGLDQNRQLLPGHRSATVLQVTLMSTAQKCWGKSLWSAVEMCTDRRPPSYKQRARINLT